MSLSRLSKEDPFSLSALELRALSVPAALLFLLGVEYDLVLCLNEVNSEVSAHDQSRGQNGFSLHFPYALSDEFCKLISLAAQRFGLHCVLYMTEAVVTGSEVRMPLLRYADYLPGGLHVDEILSALGIDTSTLPKNAMSYQEYQSKRQSSSDPNIVTTIEAGRPSFVANFIDYSLYQSDDLLKDPHGLGLYLTLDSGLPLATHNHLIRVKFTPITETAANRALVIKRGGNPLVLPKHPNQAGLTPEEQAVMLKKAALNSSERCLRRFCSSHWSNLDIRYDYSAEYFNTNARTSVGSNRLTSQGFNAILVMPSISDANLLMERYEDEESDTDDPLVSEIDNIIGCRTAHVASAIRLPFILRPVAPLTAVPALDDASFKRLRKQHWSKTIEPWWNGKVRGTAFLSEDSTEGCAQYDLPRNRNTIVIANINDEVATADIITMIQDVLPLDADGSVANDKPSDSDEEGAKPKGRHSRWSGRNKKKDNSKLPLPPYHERPHRLISFLVYLEKGDSSHRHSSGAYVPPSAHSALAPSRKKAYLVFSSSHAAFIALTKLDGKTVRGRSLRLCVAPPFIDDKRRGTLVEKNANNQLYSLLDETQVFAAMSTPAGKEAVSNNNSFGGNVKSTGNSPGLRTTPPPAANSSKKDTRKDAPTKQDAGRAAKSGSKEANLTKSRKKSNSNSVKNTPNLRAQDAIASVGAGNSIQTGGTNAGWQTGAQACRSNNTAAVNEHCDPMILHQRDNPSSFIVTGGGDLGITENNTQYSVNGGGTSHHHALNSQAPEWRPPATSSTSNTPHLSSGQPPGLKMPPPAMGAGSCYWMPPPPPYERAASGSLSTSPHMGPVAYAQPPYHSSNSTPFHGPSSGGPPPPQYPYGGSPPGSTCLPPYRPL